MSTSTPDAVAILDRALTRVADQREAFRALDAAVGDGDLGITAERGCTAIRAALDETPPSDFGDLLRTAGKAFAAGNPSTMAALVGGGLLSAAKEAKGYTEIDAALALRIGRAVFERIKRSGKAELGDKTVLDALGPSLDALEKAPPGTALDAMLRAAQDGVDATKDRAGRRGRAAWVGERGIGHPDPGGSLYVSFLAALQAAR
ncbi:DAK2 domain-containing protein [Cryptosporangium sp. NPDC048952]|uniref:DAK2 domain-containing protein n=1 Tax=Cryptosporangium sp. NPDC048952 TaxID=3363961 RepID=UPI003711081B